MSYHIQCFAALHCPPVLLYCAQIECIAPANFGRGHRLVVTASGQSSIAYAFDYDAPVITGVMPEVIDAISGTSIVVTGRNFGLQAAEGQLQPISVYIRSSLCSDLLFIRDSEVKLVTNVVVALAHVNDIAMRWVFVLHRFAARRRSSCSLAQQTSAS